jgi:hypothetical protein
MRRARCFSLSSNVPVWGASLGLSFDFQRRTSYVSAVRQLLVELCRAELGSASETSTWIMVAQELLENLAKYSTPPRASFEFELAAPDGRPRARLVTRNFAAPEDLEPASALLERIVRSDNPSALYDELVAASNAQGYSRLGLIRIRAEAGLELAYSVQGSCLELVVEGPVTPRAIAHAQEDVK